MDDPRAGRRTDRPDAVLDTAHRLAADFLAGLGDRPVWPRATYDDLLVTLGGPLPDGPTEAVAVLERLAAGADPGLAGIAGGRFFGFVMGGGLPVAVGADWLTSAWDQNAGLTALTPAVAAVETVVTQWLVDVLGLPAGTSAGFVTGGMMANFSCLAAARHAVLAGVGWDVNARGLCGGPPVRVVVGADRHDTVDLAVRYLGLGEQSVVVVPSDDEGRIRVDELARVLAAGDGPTIVCLQAGEVHTGAFDRFVDAVPLAKEHGAWVHVDGAFGLWAAASPSRRHLTEGMAGADSWATDAHKTLNVPFDSGVALVRDPAFLLAAFGVQADYLMAGAADPSSRTPELSRRARVLPIYAALRHLGRSGVAHLVDRLCAHALRYAEGMRTTPGAQVLHDVVFTQVMTSYGDDARTREVGRRVLATGEAVVTPATWRGRAAQRAAFSSWATTDADVDRTVAAVRAAVTSL